MRARGSSAMKSLRFASDGMRCLGPVDGSSGLRRGSSRFRARVGVLVLAVSCVLGTAAPVAFAGTTVDGFIGGPSGNGIDPVLSSAGGRFVAPNDAAVVEASGDVYVADGLQRMQRLDSDGRFELAWGVDVIASGAPGNVGTGFEVCTIAAHCTFGSSSASAGGFSQPSGIAVNQVPGHPQEGHVYVRDTGNLRVQEFDADGNFVRAWGWGVETGADAFEICTVTCLQGLDAVGAPDGELGSTSVEGVSIAVASTGNVYVADPANQRVQEFEGDGDFVSAFGTAGSGLGEFSSDQPARVAVDSNGIVYATDSNASNRVQRYDTTTDAFLSPVGVGPLLSGVTQGIEVDPATGHLLVIRDPSSGETVVQEIDTTALAVVDTHGEGAQFCLPNPDPLLGTGKVYGLGVDGTRGKLYVLSNFLRNPFGTSHYGVFALDGDGAMPPAPVVGAPLSVDDNSAVLSGTVDPNGPSFYRFEYSRNGVDWRLVSGVDVAQAGKALLAADQQLVGSSPQSVSASIDGLESNTVYRGRIVATKLTGPNSAIEVVSGEATFLTDAVPPTATTSPVHGYTDTSAWLSGRVNPKGSASSYRFEWGKTTAYEHQAPSPDGNAGAGGTEGGVLQEVTGLEPDTTYHYRLVAESAQGVAVGADRTFRTRPAGGFEQRAFEQVSPAVKSQDVAHPAQGGSILGAVGTNGYAVWPVADGGDALLWGVSNALSDAEWGGTRAGESAQFYRAGRGSEGWSSRLVLHRPPGPADGFGQRPVTASVDLWTFVAQADLPLLDGVEDRSLYMRDLLGDGLEPIAGSGADDNAFVPFVAGASDDLSHVFFRPADGSSRELVGGSTRLVNVDAGGVPFPDPSVLGNGGKRRYAVSADGEHAFLSTPVASSSGGSLDQTLIYRRSHGAATVLVSPSKRSVPDPQGPKGKEFELAAPSGDVVFFTSSEELTDDANTGASRTGVDLYRYEISTDTLVDVSAAPTDPDGARVVGVLGASDAGDRIYYVSCDELSGNSCPSGPKIYIWYDDGSPGGETKLVAGLASNELDSITPNGLFLDTDGRPSRVSPDGRALLFHSAASLTGYRNQGFVQVFIYEADANGGEGSLSCVSCRPNGTPAHGNSAVPMGLAGVQMGSEVSRALSDDGRRVFFNSADAVVPEDTDGEFDVYEWQAGRVRLVSAGDAPSGSDFMGASADGDSVFFITRDRLVGQDVDGYKDVYVARVGGGFASQNPVAEVPCQGEGCRPGPSSAPSAGGAASTIGGGGDYSPRLTVGRITARQRGILARRGRLTVRVQVAGPGRIRVRALIGSRTAGSGSKTARSAGPASVTLKLSRSARRMVTRRGRLRLRLVVGFGGESETTTLVLRRAK
jgi:hypothetical protein